MEPLKENTVTTTDTPTVPTALRWLGDALVGLEDQSERLEYAARTLRGLHRPDVAAVLDRHAARLAAVAAELRGEA